jgi:nicotinamide mononucleotide (NMN) deamidase PncC
VRERLQADIGIGITGVAGPDPQDGVPVGQVYIGLDGGEAVPNQALSFLFSQSREAIKRRAVTQSILLLRRALVAAG